MTAARRDFRTDRCLTRIVATVGPASASPAMLARLVRAGVSVFRLNLSHGDPPTHARTLAAIRRTAAELRVEAGVLADLPGPKIRLTAIEGGGAIPLRHGDPVLVVPGAAPIDPERRPVTLRVDYRRFGSDVRVGDRVLIDDGAVQLRVRRVRAGAVECTCEVGGTVSGRKGVNLPETAVGLRAPTARDRVLADWAVRHGADFVALSFVQGPADLRSLRRVLERSAAAHRGRVPGVVAKIERPVALGALDAIAAEADAMMVATQMLQSMMEAPLPTRAEASDVANAIFGGADAVMLSGETAAGRYPAESVDAMRRIAIATERWIAAHPAEWNPAAGARGPRHASPMGDHAPAAEVLARSIAQLATEAGARAVIAWTDAASLRFISQTDLNVPVYAFGDHDAELRSLALLRGVEAIRLPRPKDSRDFVRAAEALLRRARLLGTRNRVVVATGFAGRGTERLWLRHVGARAI
jgi:pyruvate kinase